MTRAIAVSTQPRKKPAIMPIVTPIITDRPVPMNATISDTWAPSSTREKMSRPMLVDAEQVLGLLGPGGRPKSSSASVDCSFGGGAPTSLRIGVGEDRRRGSAGR